MMEIAQASLEGAGISASLNGHWTLDRANDGDGLRYRLSCTLNLPTGGLAENLIIDASTALRVQASHLIFNARHDSSPEQAVVQVRDGTSLLVSLPLPRLIHSIGFTSATASSGKTTQLFRTDGEVITEDAVASHHNALIALQLDSGTGSGIVSGIVSGIGNDIGSGITDTVPRTGQGQPAPGIEVGIQAPALAGADNAPTPPPGNLGITDSRVVVRLKGISYAALSASSITHFNLSTGPENFRIGVRIPALGDEFSFLPLSFALDQGVDASTALTAQLQDLVKRLAKQLLANSAPSQPPPLLPDPLSIQLAFESDAPCTFAVSEFAVRYRLLRQSFPAGEPKQVLRFGVNQPQPRSVSFHLPALAQLSAASVEIAGAVGDTAVEAPAGASPLNELLAAAGHSGLRLDAFHRWASPVTTGAPLLISAWDLLVSALADNVVLYLELVRDSNGAPVEERLASAEVSAPAGGTQLLRFALAEPLLLAAGNYWLRLQSRNGNAVWLLREQTASRVLPWQTDGGHNPATFSGLAGIAQWVIADGAAGAPPQRPEITLLGQALPASRGDRNWLFDLMPVLGDSTGNGAEDGLLTRALTLLTASGSPVTVYPPRIEYDIPA